MNESLFIINTFSNVILPTHLLILICIAVPILYWMAQIIIRKASKGSFQCLPP